jgi:hypothetical protein
MSSAHIYDSEHSEHTQRGTIFHSARAETHKNSFNDSLTEKATSHNEKSSRNLHRGAWKIIQNIVEFFT